MSKVKLSYSSLRNGSVNSLDNVVNQLNEAISYLQQNSIPGDFYMANTLYNTISDLKLQRNKLSSAKSWVINSNKNYDSMIDKLEVQANKLPVYQVKRRNTII